MNKIICGNNSYMKLKCDVITRTEVKSAILEPQNTLTINFVPDEQKKA